MGRDASVWRTPFDEIPDDADLDAYELAHVRIGNLAMVARLRALIETLPGSRDRFPILLRQVLHHGTLSGDRIAAHTVGALANELAALPAGYDPDLDEFKHGIAHLCEVAQMHRRDIDF